MRLSIITSFAGYDPVANLSYDIAFEGSRAPTEDASARDGLRERRCGMRACPSKTHFKPPGKTPGAVLVH